MGKPAATGYKRVVPEDFRGLFSNFYKNVMVPVRVVNNLLQLRVGRAAIEIGRFLINSTVGVGGLRDCARDCFGIEPRQADFGQTLGRYGLGPGFYLVLPVFGPSSARDAVGLAGDILLDPKTYVQPFLLNAGVNAHYLINILSFRLGDYETLKRASLDPYVALRSGYAEARKKQIDEE